MFMMLCMLLTGLICPLEPMPAVVRAVGGLIPATYFIRIARGVITKGVGLAFMWQDVHPNLERTDSYVQEKPIFPPLVQLRLVACYMAIVGLGQGAIPAPLSIFHGRMALLPVSYHPCASAPPPPIQVYRPDKP